MNRQLLTGQTYGLSAGAEPAWRGEHAAGVAGCALFSTGAVELSVGSEDELPALLACLADVRFLAALDRFEAVSLHGPMKRLSGDWDVLACRLRAIPLRPIRGIVFHPDTLDEAALAALRPLGARLWLENMDVRKADARNADELERFFDACPKARFVLDVAHVWCLDPSLALGHELLDAYADRLVEVHLSGINPNGTHRPTTPADVEVYRPLLERCGQVPWIFETALASA